MTTSCHYARPDTIEEAIASLAASDGEGIIFAGGVALGILMNEKLVRPEWIVDISRIASLATLEVTDDGALVVGATVPNTELERSDLVARACPLLREMALEIACGRVRNRGTVGGNLCLADPQGDPPAALLALEAELELHGPGGRRRLPIADFFRHVYTTALEDNEVLERIYVPGLSSAAGTAYLKFGARQAMDYAATISAAVKLVRDGADGAVSEVAFGMGGVGITPVRPRGAEAALRGQPPVPEVLEAMTEALHSELEPVADILHSADYKRHIAGVLLRRAVARACGVGVPESTP